MGVKEPGETADLLTGCFCFCLWRRKRMESKDRRVAGGFLPGLARVGLLQIMADSSGNWRQDKGEACGSRPTEPGRMRKT